MTPVLAPVRPSHPAWLQALPHYDPGYDYQWERYEYASDFTTDPRYLVEDVKMPKGGIQESFEDSKIRMTDYVQERGLFPRRYCQIMEGRLIRDLQAWLARTHGDRLTVADFQDQVSPDMALWVTAVPLPLARSYSALTHGLPMLVMECVSDYSARDPNGTYEEWGSKLVLYAWLEIREYWIYDPTQNPVQFQGYRLVRPGQYQVILEAPEASGAYPSEVLDTVLTVTPDHNLHLWDAARDTWFDRSEVSRAEGLAEGRVQDRIDSFLRALPDTGLPPALQPELARHLERVRPHALSLPLTDIPDGGDLWRTLYQHGGPDRVPAAALWALMPTLPPDPAP